MKYFKNPLTLTIGFDSFRAFSVRSTPSNLATDSWSAGWIKWRPITRKRYSVNCQRKVREHQFIFSRIFQSYYDKNPSNIFSLHFTPDIKNPWILVYWIRSSDHKRLRLWDFDCCVYVLGLFNYYVPMSLLYFKSIYICND